MNTDFFITFFYSLFLASIFMIIIMIIRKLIVDEKRMKLYREEIQKWEESRKKVLEEKNIKKYRKIIRKRESIRKMGEWIEKEKMKSNIVSAGVWFLIFYISPYFINIKIFFPLTGNYVGFIWWYIILSLWLYPILTKIFRYPIS